jgi:hypothetical protein
MVFKCPKCYSENIDLVDKTKKDTEKNYKIKRTIIFNLICCECKNEWKEKDEVAL